MDNIQEAINWFDAEIKAQESGYAFALASGKERDEHFENWLDIMRAALVAAEALQQENEQLRAQLEDWKYNAKCDADHIAALTADKDEQTEQMKYLLRRTLPILEVTNDQQELIDAINALLGGKEDE